MDQPALETLTASTRACARKEGAGGRGGAVGRKCFDSRLRAKKEGRRIWFLTGTRRIPASFPAARSFTGQRSSTFFCSIEAKQDRSLPQEACE